MAILRCMARATRSSIVAKRSITTTLPRSLAAPHSNEGVSEWRDSQREKPTSPHMTNTNSTIANEMPSVGADKAPPELLTSVDPNFTPKDSVPENTERMTGGTQKGGPQDGTNAELAVGEMEGANFKVEPIRRTGEDGNTMRARLLCLFLYTSVSWKLLTPADIHCQYQTRVGKGEPSKVIFSYPPSQTPTSPA